jgi:hypothetical protein
MKATRPIVVDGVVYSDWQISLSVSQRLLPDGSDPISVAIRAVPSRVVEDGTIQTLDAAAFSIYRGRIEEVVDDAEREAFSEMSAAVSKFLRAKGV